MNTIKAKWEVPSVCHLASSLRAPVCKCCLLDDLLWGASGLLPGHWGGCKAALCHHCKDLGIHVHSINGLDQVTISWEISMFQSHRNNSYHLSFHWDQMRTSVGISTCLIVESTQEMVSPLPSAPKWVKEWDSNGKPSCLCAWQAAKLGDPQNSHPPSPFYQLS